MEKGNRTMREPKRAFLNGKEMLMLFVGGMALLSKCGSCFDLLHTLVTDLHFRMKQRPVTALIRT
jgi:hypothetical protein